MVPIIGSLPSAMMIRKSLYIYDNIFLMILTGPATVFSGINFLIVYGAIKAVPWTFAEAGFVDGAGDYYVMWKLILPMVFPTVLTLFVLSCLAAWNDYESVLIWMPSYPNLAYGLFRFQKTSVSGGEGVSMPVILAAFVVVIIPTSLLYLSSMNIIVRNLNVGGIKG